MIDIQECPFCGSKAVENIVVDVFSFECGTDIIRTTSESKYYRPSLCYQWELAQKVAQVVALREIIDNMEREAGRMLREKDELLKGCHSLLEALKSRIAKHPWMAGKAKTLLAMPGWPKETPDENLCH